MAKANAQTLARTLEGYRLEITEMLSAIDRLTLSANRRKDATEHLTRARQAVGLARAALMEGNENGL